MGLFLALQALVAAGYALARASDAWLASAAWWPLAVAAANVAALAVLFRLYRDEGVSLWRIFHT